MANPQSTGSVLGRRRTFQRGQSASSMFETLQESPEEEAQSGTTPDYIQHLHSVLGHETAEYFINPPAMDFDVSPALQKLLEEMEDPLGAKELWRILQEKSQQRLKEEYGEPIRPETVNVLRNFAQRPVMQKVAEKRRRLIYVRQTLEHHQDLTNLLLSEHSFLESDEDPSRHLASGKQNQPCSSPVSSHAVA